MDVCPLPLCRHALSLSLLLLVLGDSGGGLLGGRSIWFPDIDGSADFPLVNRPFKIGFRNLTVWMEQGYVWSFLGPSCNLSTIRHPVTEVLCIYPGEYILGYYEEENLTDLLGFRHFIVKRNQQCFDWKVDIHYFSEGKSSIKVLIQDASRGMSSGNGRIEPQQLGNLYHNFGERPSVVAAFTDEMLGMTDQTLNVTFVDGFWFADLLMPGSVVQVQVRVFSSYGISLVDCLVRPVTSVVASDGFRFSQSSVQILQTSLKDQVIQEPCSSSRAFLIWNHQIFYTSNNFESSALWNLDFLDGGIVDDMLLVNDRVLILSSYRLYTVNRTGEIRSVNESRRFYRMFSSATCYLNFNAPRYVALLVEDQNSTICLLETSSSDFVCDEVPGCEQGCIIKHVDLNPSLDLMRCLLQVSSGSTSFNYVLMDYYLYLRRWTTYHAWWSSENLHKFAFFPASSESVVLIGNETVTLWEEGSSFQVHQLTSPVVQISVYHLRCWMLLSSGYVLQMSFGSSETHEMFFSEIGFVFRSYDNLYKIIRVNDTVVREVYPLRHEVAVASGRTRSSIYTFSSSVDPKWYFLDKGSQFQIRVELVADDYPRPWIQIQFDSALGLNVTSTQKTRLENNLVGLYMMIQISIDDRAPNVSRLGEARTAISLVPRNYSGPADDLKVQVMAIRIGCPTSHRLRFSMNIVSCIGFPDYPAEVSHCLQMEAESVVTTAFLLFDGETYLHDRFVRADVARIEGRPDSVFVRTEVFNGTLILRLDAKNSDSQIVKVVAFPDQSFCQLEAYLHVEVRPVADTKRNVIVVISIVLGTLVYVLLLAASFLQYKRRTALEQEHAAEQMKRQQELRYLASLQHYQELLQVRHTTAAAGMARRRNSSVCSGSVSRIPSLASNTSCLGTIEEQ